VTFVFNCLPNVVAVENIVVVVPMAEMVEKLSHHHCGIPVEFGVLELLLVMAIILGIPVPPEFSLIYHHPGSVYKECCGCK